jgi:hypothetical protein
MPSWPARSSASSIDPVLEYRDGIDRACTWSAPSASVAIVATKAESMPPESPTTTSVNPFFDR